MNEYEWAAGLGDNARRLDELARFYHGRRLLVVATLLSAAAAAIRDEAERVTGVVGRRRLAELHHLAPCGGDDPS